MTITRSGARLRHRPRRLARRHSRAQGLVEFALVGGLFFFLLFSTMNAGFFLYGFNAMEHSADVGVATIAAEGNYSNSSNPVPNNADTVAISRMGTAGLTTTPLTTVTEIDVWREIEQSSGVFVDDTTGCGGGPCENRYDVNGNILNSGGVAPWPPGGRNVSSTPDFAKLVITFNYKLFAGNTTFTLSTKNLFRLEPQI